MGECHQAASEESAGEDPYEAQASLIKPTGQICACDNANNADHTARDGEQLGFLGRVAEASDDQHGETADGGVGYVIAATITAMK